MASPVGRGAQVRLDGEAQAAARGALGLRLAETAEAKRLLELAGVVPDGSTFDGSTLSGLPAEDEVIAPGGVASGDGAQLIVGTTSGTVAAGNDPRIVNALSAATAVATYATKISPAFTGTPTAPTPGPTVNTDQIATMAAVQAVVQALIGAAPAQLNTLTELAAALNNDPTFAASLTSTLAGKAPLASPALTGSPTAPTATLGDNTTKLATTAYVIAAYEARVAALEAKVASLSSAGTNYYVSASGSDANTGLSVSQPLLTIGAAHDKTNPGDIVYILNGTYGGGDYSDIVISRSGTAAAPITYAAYPGHAPVILGNGTGTWRAMDCQASYVTFRGLTFKGNNPALTLSGAQASYNSYYAGGARSGTDWGLYASYNCTGLGIGTFNGTIKPHHVAVYDCIAYDFPAGGINADWADYITVEGCTVHDCCIYSMYAPSGISMYENWSFDSNTGFRNFIRRNRSYNNKTQVPWSEAGGIMSDGNGIIIDDFRGTQNTIPAYVGKTLVENNLCYNNGGAGINAYASPNVFVVNNTLYRNGTVVGYADLMMNETIASSMINNVVSARAAAAKANDQTNATSLTRLNNTLFGATVQGTGVNELTSDPLFTNAAAADFTLQAGSPSRDSGSTTSAPTTDITLKARPGSGIDRGCFEA